MEAASASASPAPVRRNPRRACRDQPLLTQQQTAEYLADESSDDESFESGSESSDDDNDPDVARSDSATDGGLTSEDES